MSRDVTDAVVSYLSSNRGPSVADPAARVRPVYGIVATLAGNLLDLRLTFRRGAAYCCFEPGCHLGLFTGRRWDSLRTQLTAVEATVPSCLELRLKGEVEAGALCFGGRPMLGRHGVYHLEPSHAYSYEVTEQEGEPSG